MTDLPRIDAISVAQAPTSRTRALARSLSAAEPQSGSRIHALGVVRPASAMMQALRPFAIEAPVAIEYNGIGYAVMMATPTDLHDFAVGFSLSEQLVTTAADILAVDAVEQINGWILRMRIASDRQEPVIARARRRLSESSCGLCGLESLAEVMRPLRPITAKPGATRAALFSARDAIRDHQPINGATGAAHGAAFCTNDGAIRLVREDVGRHNAFDKLIGALAREGTDPATGFFLLTARCSYELVEKTVTAGCPLLVTISAPTTLAADRATAHGLSLVALARADAMLIVSDPYLVFA